MTITRRLLLGLLADGARRMFGAGSIPPQPNARTYRVDATILLFSLSIFTRAGVGKGHARHGVTRSLDRSIHELEFAAGSLPDRAHGLNRLGLIRETVAEAGTGILEASYFGFMTASKEESLGEARKALAASTARSTFVAIEGQSRPGEADSRRARFYSDARAGWNDLEREAKAAVRDPALTSGQSRFPSGRPGAAAPTFLFSLYRAMASGETHLKQTCVYSGDRFELTTSKKPDPATGRRFADKGLALRAEAVVALTGTIHNLRTGNKTPFRMWSEEASLSVPLRIEYQPRGFLRLALEAEGQLTRPV
jgi:hypothetical protein